MKTLTSKFVVSRTLELQLHTSSSSSNTNIISPSFFPLQRLRHHCPIFSSPSYLRPRTRNSKLVHLSASLSHLSWLSPHQSGSNDYNGWAIVESPPENNNKKKGFSTFVIGVTVGSSFALLLAAISYFSLSRTGFKLQFGSSWNVLNDILKLNETNFDESKTVDSRETDGDNIASPGPKCVQHDTGSVDRLERVIVSVATDSTQQESLSILKKLKIIEDNVETDKLCTRREYARWLVCINSSLERSPKHRIVPSISLSGSVVAAFNDVDVEDPDFEFIQALAEAGIVPSKLSGKNYGSDHSEGQQSVNFFPERFISRQDLIGWKAQVEYEFKPEILQKISTKVGYMDVKAISSEAPVELYMDLLAGDKSIARRVFGQSKRFQPNKPSTKAQAAVALVSGRMAEATYNELSRLEAERSSRQAEMEEIRSELLDRGDIQRCWDEKFSELRTQCFEVEKLYASACADLEQELNVQEMGYAEALKEKAAMDCQRQLLLNLKEEVDEMTEKLASERAMFVDEKCKLQNILGELLTKQDGLLDTKSILEAEKEALRILRSWVEDEARKSQARAKVLEEVGRRWRWNSHA
ncbi:uncharacterized protein LOC123215118 isoform X2 [Mangifera indica]|uniref:uncharacterized protein LOC123215118 isoform X2 n=1 Tax=Mangifera indica TaxID=29780 RepID=UPI001CFC1E39|nr:uncharacterized protein LOC123215118 isoform X2 [Mangifera indica]